jgi:ribosomal protein L1
MTKKEMKITEEELQKLQSLVKLMTDIKTALGSAEIEKANLLSNYETVQDELDKARESLKEIYGDINVNLSTGEYEEIEG